MGMYAYTWLLNKDTRRQVNLILGGSKTLRHLHQFITAPQRPNVARVRIIARFVAAKIAGNLVNCFKNSKEKEITGKRSYNHWEFEEKFFFFTSDFIASFFVLRYISCNVFLRTSFGKCFVLTTDFLSASNWM